MGRVAAVATQLFSQREQSFLKGFWLEMAARAGIEPRGFIHYQ